MEIQSVFRNDLGYMHAVIKCYRFIAQFGGKHEDKIFQPQNVHIMREMYMYTLHSISFIANSYSNFVISWRLCRSRVTFNSDPVEK